MRPTQDPPVWNRRLALGQFLFASKAILDGIDPSSALDFRQLLIGTFHVPIWCLVAASY
jgi:hypothetical protein